MKFPIKIRINPIALEEFRDSEYGSFEDDEEGVTRSYSPLHAYEILGRAPAAIIVNDADEAAEIYWRVCSGTFQLNNQDDGENRQYFKTACRIAAALRPAVQEAHPSVVAVWPAPSGY